MKRIITIASMGAAVIWHDGHVLGWRIHGVY